MTKINGGRQIQSGTVSGGGLAGIEFDAVTTTESTSSTTLTDLATVGPAVTVTIGASGQALVFWSFVAWTNATPPMNTYCGPAVSGATTQAPGHPYLSEKVWTTLSESGTVNGFGLMTGLNPGSTTFTLKYAAGSAGSVSFLRRRLLVIPI